MPTVGGTSTHRLLLLEGSAALRDMQKAADDIPLHSRHLAVSMSALVHLMQHLVCALERWWPASQASLHAQGNRGMAIDLVDQHHWPEMHSNKGGARKVACLSESFAILLPQGSVHLRHQARLVHVNSCRWPLQSAQKICCSSLSGSCTHCRTLTQPEILQKEKPHITPR